MDRLGAEQKGVEFLLYGDFQVLVLSRKRGQWLVITLADGREVRVQVVDIKGKQIRIGIEAPKDVPVLRGELRRVA
jgi:carbon storage regulator